MKKKEFKKVAIVGLGLIGGSLARALKKSEQNRERHGHRYR